MDGGNSSGPFSVTAPGAQRLIELSVVIPAYNETGSIQTTLRIVSEYLRTCGFTWEVVVVDDGSGDDTASLVTEFAAVCSEVRLVRNSRNLGKGATVSRGVLDALGSFIFFMDADLAVPIDELGPALALIARDDHRILIGSRRVAGARIERHQPLLREYLGYGFTELARWLLNPAVVDFTCGFKGFRREEARMLFSLQRCTDWAFDAEIIYLARLLGEPIYQYPVRWSHQKSSRVRFPRDIWRTLVALLLIRLRGRKLVRDRLAHADIEEPADEA